jgi:hypothetical protein
LKFEPFSLKILMPDFSMNEMRSCFAPLLAGPSSALFLGRGEVKIYEFDHFRNAQYWSFLNSGVVYNYTNVKKVRRQVIKSQLKLSICSY